MRTGGSSTVLTERLVIERHHRLVDRGYMRQYFDPPRGLGAVEVRELAVLERMMDRYDEPFYRPILQRLQEQLAALPQRAA